jgi:hypothetical protein
MATIAGQRAAFTWALNQYNTSDDPNKQAHFVRLMAKYIRNAPTNNFTPDQITQGQSYPADKVRAVLDDPNLAAEPDISEAQAKHSLEEAVDSSNVRRKGDGPGILYAYGYKCAPDRLKIGYTDGDTIERIAAQIWTSTPDKPVLALEIKTQKSHALERALHSILEYRGKKIKGGGDEWFITTVQEIESLFDFIDSRV